MSHPIAIPTDQAPAPATFCEVSPLHQPAMACGGGIFSRALGYVVNEFLVQGLANNRAFQRFAVRTNRTFENLSSRVKQMREEVSEQVRDSRGQDNCFKE